MWQSEKAFWPWAAIDGRSWLLLTGPASSDLALVSSRPLTNRKAQDLRETIDLLTVKTDPSDMAGEEELATVRAWGVWELKIIFLTEESVDPEEMAVELNFRSLR